MISEDLTLVTRYYRQFAVRTFHAAFPDRHPGHDVHHASTGVRHAGHRRGVPPVCAPAKAESLR